MGHVQDSLIPRTAKLAVHERCDGADRLEIFELQIIVLDRDAEFFFDEEYELHRQQRIHGTRRKDRVVVASISVAAVPSHE
jgi:hypothetical protein